ncbi:hypothetical protein EBX93_16535 [bacterium]|nr:hypothetical protein [bacterium]
MAISFRLLPLIGCISLRPFHIYSREDPCQFAQVLDSIDPPKTLIGSTLRTPVLSFYLIVWVIKCTISGDNLGTIRAWFGMGEKQGKAPSGACTKRKRKAPRNAVSP